MFPNTIPKDYKVIFNTGLATVGGGCEEELPTMSLGYLSQDDFLFYMLAYFTIDGVF